MFAVIVAIAHFFYGTCPSFEKVGENFKKTFLSSSSDKKYKEESDKKESYISKMYETAKNAGGIVVEGCKAAGNSFLDFYLVSGKYKDEKGEFNPPSWCDGLKKFHKKSDSILKTEADNENKNKSEEVNNQEITDIESKEVINNKLIENLEN